MSSEQENKLIKLIKLSEASAARYMAKIKAARKALDGKCSHPNPKPWEWEHDNGYGRQERMKGLQCLLCMKVNRWPRMSNNWDDDPYAD